MSRHSCITITLLFWLLFRFGVSFVGNSRIFRVRFIIFIQGSLIVDGRSLIIPIDKYWIPNTIFGQNIPMSFLGRVFATLMTLCSRYIKVGVFYPNLEPMLREKLNISDMPSLQQLSSDASLVLMNSHFSEELARSLPPMVIPVGRMHCTDKLQQLPKDIAKFINESEGFIYMSFGSAVKFSGAPEHLRNVFFNAIGNSTMRFIWKWEGPRPNEMPSNILISSWAPQQTILAHPKIRMFITHGGLLSIQEAIYHAVPLITFPIFAEQDYNSERLVRTKRGIRLDITTVTQKVLEEAIETIMTNDMYKLNMQKDSKLFKDRPQTPTDTAVWWMEYIIRNKDNVDILRPHAIKQWWFQRRLLDVWGFIAAIMISSFVLSYFICKKVFYCCGFEKILLPYNP